MILARTIAANAILVAGGAAIVYLLKDVGSPIPMSPGGIGAVSLGLVEGLIELAVLIVPAFVLLRIARRRGTVSAKAPRLFWSIAALLLVADMVGVASTASLQGARMVSAITFSSYVALVTYAGYKAVVPVSQSPRSE